MPKQLKELKNVSLSQAAKLTGLNKGEISNNVHKEKLYKNVKETKRGKMTVFQIPVRELERVHGADNLDWNALKRSKNRSVTVKETVTNGSETVNYDKALEAELNVLRELVNDLKHEKSEALRVAEKQIDDLRSRLDNLDHERKQATQIQAVLQSQRDFFQFSQQAALQRLKSLGIGDGLKLLIGIKPTAQLPKHSDEDDTVTVEAENITVTEGKVATQS